MKYILNDIAVITSSKRIFANEYQSTGIPFYRGKEITQLYNHKAFSDLLYISEKKYNELIQNVGVPQENDILITAVGTIGSLYLVNKDDKFYFKDGNLIWLKNIDKTKVIPKYLYYLLSTDETHSLIDSITIGSTQTALTIEGVKMLNFDFPELKVQQHIVDTIGSIDDLIELNDKKIQLLTIFGKQLYDKILLTNNHKKIQLNKLVSIYRGASPRPIQDYVVDKGKPWVKISDATSISNPFLFETKEFINTEGVKHSFEVYPNDFILSNSATPGLPIFIQINACVHDGWLIIRNFKKISPEYLYWVLKKDRNHLLSLGNGSIFTNLKTEILKTHEVPIFDDTTMESINTKFKKIIYTMKNLVENNNKLNNIKNILLKKYFG